MKKITLIGLGALGSHAALALRNVGHLKLVDFDLVEQKNTLAQFHTKMSLRRNKAQAMQQAMLGLWGLKVEVVPHKVTDDNVAVILAGSDLVIDATDNIAARACIKGYCEEAGLPLLHGAMSQDGTFAQVVWTEEFEVEAGEGGATCEDGENLPFHVLVGAYIAQVAKDFFDKGKRRNFQVTPGRTMGV
jgi:molybdopterin/thiamine biosynthesis adenylyltransferase